MCGIFAYTGTKQSLPILLNGLTSLEYRGYDSAGIYIPESGSVKSVGAVENLKSKIKRPYRGTSGISHLRWATHGKPTEANAHPHTDCDKNIHIVHNGIIENHKTIRDRLIKLGHSFTSSTDTEVLAHLIEHHLRKTKNIEKAVIASLKEVKGTYTIAVSYKKEPEKIITARFGAPVVLGVGANENFIASDATPLLTYTNKIIYLEDGDFAVITPRTYTILNSKNKKITRVIHTLKQDIEEVKKEGYKHFMLKEIMEGPQVIKNAVYGRSVPKKGLVLFDELDTISDKLRSINRIIIVGCGTASYAGLVGEYMFEEYAGIPVEVEVGSEFRYRNAPIDTHTALLAISQSGETADTLEALREAKRKGALTISIVNTVGSTIARETDASIYNHAGPEISVASTKAFISQLTVLALLSVYLGRQRKMTSTQAKQILKEVHILPKKLQSILEDTKQIHAIAKKYITNKNFLYLGRKMQYPIALEGAIKLKEISYVHAEGCGAGEMKHGPLAMIDEYFPTVALALRDSVYEKMISNIEEIKARKGNVIIVASIGDTTIQNLSDDIMYIPKTLEIFSPILSVVPLQLFAYYFAVEKGLKVDRPRNLAKSVTVE